jgi:putative salt-induced outer membrane protein YdiY
MFKPFRSVFTLLLSCAAFAATAGELRLDNGAVLPGELASVGDKTLVWKADKIGEVTVTKSDVVTLQTSSKIPVEIAQHQPAQTDCTVTVKNRQWSVDCAEQAVQSVAVSEFHSVLPATRSSGKFTTSLDIERGANRSETVELDLTARWFRPTHRHNADVSVDYETSQGDTTDDEADANYQYDLLRKDGWYWYGRLRYYRDKFETLQEVYAAGAGIGREFTPAEDLNLSIQGGPMEMRFYYNSNGDNNGNTYNNDSATEPGGAVRWTADWKTPWRGITASHSGDLGWIFTLDNGYLFQSSSGLTFPLYAGLIAEVRLDYDRTGVAALDGSKYDFKWVLGLGYKW